MESTDGYYYVSGTSWSTDINVYGNYGESDIWVVKLDQNGNIDWQKCFGGSGRDEDGSFIELSNGGFLLAGQTWSDDNMVSGNHSVLSSDFWIVRSELPD